MAGLPRARLTWIAAALLLTAFAAQSTTAMVRHSTTSDETTHLPSGYTYLVTGDLRLNPEHPPLIKMLCALPLLALDPKLDLEHPGWNAEPPRQWKFGQYFLYTNDARAMLFWGRLPVVALGLLLGFYLFLWGRALYGNAGALTALTLFAFSPNLLAHSHLVTTDMALASFGTATLYHLWRWGREHRRADLILLGVMLGLALASKFSAALLVPVVVVLGLADALRAKRLRRDAVLLLVPLGIAALLVWAAYLFPRDPGFYLDGMQTVDSNVRRQHLSYLAGRWRSGPWWYYFPVAFLLKTPLPTLLLLVVAAVCVRRFRARGPIDDAYLLLPVVVYLVVISARAQNIGVRYLLPVYPLLFLFISRLGRQWTRSRVWAAAGVLLAAWYVVGAARIHPHHISYFNEAIGGPAHGHEYLDDSNIDWGQGLVELAEYVEEHGIEDLKLRWEWNGSPSYWGIEHTELSLEDTDVLHPEPGLYAFSTHALIRGKVFAEVYGIGTDWLNRFEPVDRIAYHTWFFRIEEPEARRWRSALFPANWTPDLTNADGRFLHDFSYAGYRRGEAALPALDGTAEYDVVTGFGADPAGTADATAAIQGAIDAAEAAGGGIVRFPAGLFRVDGVLLVRASGVVLRGEGPEESQVYFTRHEGMTGRSHLTFKASTSYAAEARLAADAVPRATTILLADATGFSVGDDVDVGIRITDEFVAEHGMTGVWKAFNGKWQPFLRREVRAVDTRARPHRVTLDVPIRYPLKVRDGASVKLIRGMIDGVGVERLGLANAVAEKAAWANDRVHVLELSGVKDAWVRGVRSFVSPAAPEVEEGERPHLQSGGILVRYAKRVTVSDCSMAQAQHRGGGGNGYLFEVRQSSEVLFRDCVARRGRHNFIQNWGFGTTGCVWLRCESRDGEAVNALLRRPVRLIGHSEYHHSLATANLVDSCVVDDGWSAMNRGTWSSGAGHTATQCVFWNVGGTGLVRSAQHGHGYVIGTGPNVRVYAPSDEWVEGKGRAEELDPPSLYEEQLRRRTR